MSASTLQSPELTPSPLEMAGAPALEQMGPPPEDMRFLQPVERPTIADGWEYHGQNTERVNQAIEDAPFVENTELLRGLETFYGEHRQLGSTIDALLDHEPPTDNAERESEGALLQAVVDSSPLKDSMGSWYSEPNKDFFSEKMNVKVATTALATMRLARLKNPDDIALKSAELRLIKAASEVIYAEPSVGITTIGEAELLEISERQTKIQQRIESSGLFTTRLNDPSNFVALHEKSPGGQSISTNFSEDPSQQIQRAINTFWADSRFAGQLLFHGSVSFDDMYRTGMLTTRRVQEHFWGDYNTNNRRQSGTRLHSPVPHFSENYHETNYRRQQGAENSGTLAIPLAEIIKYAPIARDSEYATLHLKPELEEAIIPRITVNDTVERTGAGSNDIQGRYGDDRDFYRSAHDADPSAPLSEAPDGYAIPLSESVMRIALGEEADKSYRYGYGEHMPVHVEIPVVNPYTSKERLQDAVLEARQKTIADTIRKLQHDSIRKYGEQIVVPIRSGIMEFQVEDSSILRDRPLARFAERPAS